MIAIDTNMIVRLLSRDDEEQFQRAYELFETNRVFIATTVVLECEWVLRYAYKLDPLDVVSAMRRLFGLQAVVLEETRPTGSYGYSVGMSRDSILLMHSISLQSLRGVAFTRPLKIYQLRQATGCAIHSGTLTIHSFPSVISTLRSGMACTTPTTVESVDPRKY